jgi:hypothetical protein
VSSRRAATGDHAFVLTLLAQNGCKSIAKELQARYLQACEFSEEADAHKVDWRTAMDCMLAKIDQNCGSRCASLDFRYIERFSTPAFCTRCWKAEVQKRLSLRLRDIGFLMDAHCYYAAANEAHHLVHLYREAVRYGGHDFTHDERFRMSLEAVPYLEEALRLTRAPQFHSDYSGGNDEEVRHKQELLACLENVQHEIQLPVPRRPQHTHEEEEEADEENGGALDMELDEDEEASSSDEETQ